MFVHLFDESRKIFFREIRVKRDRVIIARHRLVENERLQFLFLAGIEQLRPNKSDEVNAALAHQLQRFLVVHIIPRHQRIRFRRSANIAHKQQADNTSDRKKIKSAHWFNNASVKAGTILTSVSSLQIAKR